MTPDPTPQPDHGAAGFCGNHRQVGVCDACGSEGYCTPDCTRDTAPTPQSAPDERTETAREAIEDGLTFIGRHGLHANTPFVVKVHEGDIDRAAAAVVAALGDETARLRRERDAARTTIHRMNSATITALRATGVWEDNLGVVSSIRALAADRDGARAEVERLTRLERQTRGELAEAVAEHTTLRDDLATEERASEQWARKAGEHRAALDRVRALTHGMADAEGHRDRIRAALDPEEPQACERDTCHLPRGHAGLCDLGRDALPRERYDAVLDSGATGGGAR